MSSHVFQVYVAGTGEKTQSYLNQLYSFLDETIENKYRVDVVDVLSAPEEAQAHGILATPTLVRIDPPPPVKFVGKLSNKETLLQTLKI